MKRSLCFAAVLVLATCAGFGAEPKAVISGPTTASVNQEFWVKFPGTVSDNPAAFELAQGPDVIVPELYYSKDGALTGATVIAPKAGRYIFALVAEGMSPTANSNVRKYAFLFVDVGGAPPPTPPPTPTPTPDPPPPTPTPAYNGALWGVLVLPDNYTPAQASLRTAAVIKTAFTANKAIYRSYLASEKEVSGPVYQSYLKTATLPVVVWVGEGGKVLSMTQATTTDSVIAELKRIRGTK